MRIPPRQRSGHTGTGGLTLIELLVVLGSIGILISLLLPAVNAVRERARQAREVSAARQLMAAYHLYPIDNDERLLPGYADLPAQDRSGEPVSRPSNSRYPYRLAPYLDFQFEGTLYVNQQAGHYASTTGNPDLSVFMRHYTISLYPSFGLNQYFLGGHEQIGESRGIRPVRRIDASGAENDGLIVFLSARSPDTQPRPGYFYVGSPQFPSPWSGKPYTEETVATQYGYVHPRWNGRAVAAMLGGQVALLNMDELRDMRRWSPQAREAGDPGWRPLH